jgi:hypothetical protein
MQASMDARNPRQCGFEPASDQHQPSGRIPARPRLSWLGSPRTAPDAGMAARRLEAAVRLPEGLWRGFSVPRSERVLTRSVNTSPIPSLGDGDMLERDVDRLRELTRWDALPASTSSSSAAWKRTMPKPLRPGDLAASALTS